MMATDLADFLGSAIGLSLLFKLPLLTATLITGLDIFLILGLQRYGFRKVDYAILSLIAVVSVAYLIEIWLSRLEWGALAYSTVVPRLNSGLTVWTPCAGSTPPPSAAAAGWTPSRYSSGECPPRRAGL